MFNALKRLFGSKPDPEVAAARERMNRDHVDAAKRSVFCLLAISNPADPAYRQKMAQTAVAQWYGIEDRNELIERIHEYLEGGMSTPAYDAFRAAFLARAGEAVGYLSSDESWQLAQQAVRRVQQTYDGWMSYGIGYLEGHLNYRRSEGDDHDTLQERKAGVMQKISELSADLWGRTPFTTAI